MWFGEAGISQHCSQLSLGVRLTSGGLAERTSPTLPSRSGYPPTQIPKEKSNPIATCQQHPMSKSKGGRGGMQENKQKPFSYSYNPKWSGQQGETKFQKEQLIHPWRVEVGLLWPEDVSQLRRFGFTPHVSLRVVYTRLPFLSPQQTLFEVSGTKRALRKLVLRKQPWPNCDWPKASSCCIWKRRFRPRSTD